MVGDALVSVLVTKKPSRKSDKITAGMLGEAADRDECEVLIEEGKFTLGYP
jgi:hypothetical protein